MQGSTQALAEIVRNTEIFLKESGEELSQEDRALIEQKLNEAKIKCEQLNLKAEQSKKELDKAVTSAIQEEAEKVLVQVCGCTVALPEMISTARLRVLSVSGGEQRLALGTEMLGLWEHNCQTQR